MKAPKKNQVSLLSLDLVYSKKAIFTFLFSAFVATSAMSGCASPEKKVENAAANVVDANQELTKAQEAYNKDVERFKKETSEKIAANEKSIAEFNARIAKDKKQAKADYKTKIAALEQKNTDMKKRMDDYKSDSKDKWESFQREFNHDMDELGNSLKDLTKNNTK